ncbi:MAG: penicillin acylase family protein, partial [Flavobacteriales bacterium]|nr:penicillin acylase family protein [Flavobacteriales bacterium]MDW8410129.1 penicillin acylase family protein [Flavobacteriales bacterium]
HGPVYKRKRRYYALRYPACTDIRSAEQWWRMGKAHDLSDFEKALRMDALPQFNVIYADREGHILLHSGGRTPWRDTTLPWKQPLPGYHSSYIWTSLLPFEKKTWIVDPPCGYLYNANNTPAHYSHPACEHYKPPQWPGFQKFDYNRGDRFRELLAGFQGRFTLSHFLAIKFDCCYSFGGSYERNFGPLYRLDDKKYPRLADAIDLLKNWNRCGNMESEAATLAMITHHFLSRMCRCPLALLMVRPKPLTEPQCVKALQLAVRFMRRRYGSLRVPLGDIQRLMRDTVSLPVAGMREVPRAIHTTLVDRKKGLWKVTGGDSFILFARFGQEGPEVWTVNTYGASGRPDSPHYTDQMRLFAEHRFKSMTLNKEIILRNATKVYSPFFRP